jgi:uncharacterized protein YhbP (UPF0306 family)
MTNLSISFNHPEFSDYELAESIQKILDHNFILAMATVRDGHSYINSAHFAYTDRLELIIFTHPASEHAKNLALNPSIAVTIWNEPQPWITDLYGVQFFGKGALVTPERLQEAIETYSHRFPAFSELIQTPEDFDSGLTALRLYSIRVERMKLIDETLFGERNWITADIGLPVEVETQESALYLG